MGAGDALIREEHKSALALKWNPVTRQIPLYRNGIPLYRGQEREGRRYMREEAEPEVEVVHPPDRR